MISIIIPVYNTAKYLDQCLESVLEQSYTDWECIVVDDGSTDNSGAICDNWGERDNRFVIIHQKNQGVSAARNHGLERSKGEYICFIDSDDWVEPMYLSHLYYGMKNNEEVDMVVSGFISEGDKSEFIKPQKKQIIKLRPEGTKDLMVNINLLYGPCFILYCSSIIYDNHLQFPIDVDFGEDTIFNYNYLRHVQGITFITEADYHYRMLQTNSLSYRFGESRTFARYDLWKMREAFYKEKELWNQFSQANMYRELWAIVYDGIFSTPNPSLRFLKKLLSIPEISYLKDWESLFSTSKAIKLGIESRAYRSFYLLRHWLLR